MADVLCAQCRRKLAEGEAKRIPSWLSLPVAFALAFGHGGMWAREELSRVYCVSCRRKVAGFAVLVAAVAVALASVGLALWLRGPRP
jgi:hypothetical protein